jgi:hypothetical protein
LKSKKGFFEMTGALVILFAIIFMFAMMGLFLFQPLNEINNDMQADAELSNTSKAVMADLTDRFDLWNDAATATIMILLVIVMSIVAYFSAQHPAYTIVLVILFIGMLIVLPVLSNVWDSTAGSEEYSEYRDNFPITNFILNNFVLVIIVNMLIITFAMYSGRNS